MTIQLKKELFLSNVSVNSKKQATGNALRASLQHNPTYNCSAGNRAAFRDAFANALVEQTERYQQGVQEDTHTEIIEDIAKRLSYDYGEILKNQCLRIGTVQKALNLYLKIHWCIDPAFATPPHCPIDRIILRSAGMYGNWTELNSIGTYKNWISQLQKHATTIGYSSLSEWELFVWTT